MPAVEIKPAPPWPIRQQAAAVVYHKARWTDQWEAVPGLICQTVQFALNAISQATFRWHYGAIMQREADAFQQVYPLSLAEHWLKVEIVPNDAESSDEHITWIGIAAAETHSRHGGQVTDISGDQLIVAFSPEYLLTRVQVIKSRVRGTSGDYFVDHGLAFNAYKSDRAGGLLQRGNKADNFLAFADDLSDAEEWSVGDIIEYLITYVLKRAHGETHPVPLRDVEIDLELASGLDYTPGEVPADGRTLFDIVDSLFSRDRGLAWHMEFTGTGAGPQGFVIKAISLADQDVDLPGDQFLPANDNRVTLSTYDVGELAANITEINHTRRYKQVIVEGGYIGSVFTVSFADGTLERDWTVGAGDEETDDEADYKTAASGTDGYAGLDLSAKQARNDAARTTDKLRHVFTRFRIPQDWDGMVGDGEGGQKYAAFPVLPSQAGNIPTAPTQSLPLWVHGMRFEPVTPMRSRIDNTGYESTDPPNDNPEQSLPDWVRPFAFVQYSPPAISSEATPIYYLLDGLSIAAAEDETAHESGNGIELSCALRVHDHQLGLSCFPSGPPHALYSAIEFTNPQPETSEPAASHLKRGYVNYTTLGATVYAKSHQRLRYAYPEKPYKTIDDEGDEVQIDRLCDLHSTLLIRVGDRARLDLVTKGTVLDVRSRDGQERIVRAPRTTAVRDDVQLLATIAKMAYSWHQTERRAVRIAMRHLWGEVKVGQMVERMQFGRPVTLAPQGDPSPVQSTSGAALLINNSSNLQINSVVSSVTYNVEQGITQFTTAFAEPDFGQGLG